MSNKFTIIYKESGKNDIYSILDYISQDNPAAAKKFILKLTEKIGSLESFPYLGTVPREAELLAKGYRMLIIDTCIVFYVPIKSLKEVRIHRVLSAKQNYTKFL